MKKEQKGEIIEKLTQNSKGGRIRIISNKSQATSDKRKTMWKKMQDTVN